MNDKGRSRHVPLRFLLPAFLITVAWWGLVPCALCQTDNLIPLWPLSAPMAKSTGVDDNPAISLYLPASHQLTAGVIICPSGDYMSMSLDRDGRQVAEWLNKLGIAAFVLRYRLAPTYRYPVPLLDAQRAVRYVRANASLYNLAAGKIGIMGFSAGGHLASMVATHFDTSRTPASDGIDRMSSRPDFLILAYPLISCSEPFRNEASCSNLLGSHSDSATTDAVSSEKHVTAKTPPTFIFHTYDDASVSVDNSLAFFSALHQANVPAELHIFEQGSHGAGLAQDDPALSAWTKLLENWFRERGLLSKAVLP